MGCGNKTFKELTFHEIIYLVSRFNAFQTISKTIMKKVFVPLLSSVLLLFQFICTQPLYAQCWNTMNGGVTPNIAIGYEVTAMTEYNGNQIVAGLFTTVGGSVAASNIAQWNGTSWSALGSGIAPTSSGGITNSVNAMTIYNNELYVAGRFDTAGGIPVNGLAKWNGTSWSAVNNGTHQLTGSINTMAVYNGDLYVGGYFDSIGGIATTGIAKWDGTSWSALAGGLNGLGGDVESLTPYNGNLYVGGLFTTAGGIAAHNIAVWNGTTWSGLDTGVVTACHCGGVLAITPYQGNIYAALQDEDTSSYSTGHLAMWDGSSWSYLLGDPHAGYYYGNVNAMCTYNGKLMVGGYFQNVGTDTVNDIVQWNGTAWSNLNGGGVGDIYTSGILTMDSANGYLFIGGYFLETATTSAGNVVEYGCANGIQEISNGLISIYPNPSNGIINISFENSQDASIVIYDLMGEKVIQSKLNTNQAQFDLRGHASGTYLYRVSGENGEDISSGSFIIQ